MDNLAPIALFTYNRLEHLQKTVDALKKNILAPQSDLIVFSDGWKNETDKIKVERVRDYLKTIDGFKSVKIIEKETNNGLSNNLIQGISETLKVYDRIIVVEDDLVTSPFALKFLNEALEIYKNDENVATIHSHIENIKGLPALFFSYKSGCLVWATWARAWNEVIFDGKYLLNEIITKGLSYKFDLNGSYLFTLMLKEQTEGKLQSWAVRAYASFFLKNMLTLYPGESMAEHIGYDEGTHFENREKNDIDGVLTTKEITAKRIPIEVNQKALRKIASFHRKRSNRRLLVFKRRTKKLISLIKKIIKVLIKNILPYGIVRHFKQKNTAEMAILSKFENWPRYKPGELSLLGIRMAFPDAASLISAYKAIFVRGIYSFTPVSNNPYIIDAGSNIGLSVIYFKKKFPTAFIDAYEADPGIFFYLKCNIEKYNWGGVNIYNSAVFDKNTTLSFFSEGADGVRINENKSELLKVDAIDINEIIKGDRRIDLLKIDIEGSELVVLERCKERLMWVDNLFVEYHSPIDSHPQKLSKILILLENAGFRYNIKSVYADESPFIIKSIDRNGFDLQLEIFAWRLA